MPRDLSEATTDEIQVLRSDNPGIFDRLCSGEAVLAIWERPQPAPLAMWLDAVPAACLPEGRFVGPAACVRARIRSLCELAGLPDGAGREMFVEDVADLARRFATLAGSPEIDLRLEPVDHDSCWRFHQDYVGYRLNTTYRGPGTQWPPLEHASRAMRGQRRYRGPLNEMPRFSVGIFKGVERAGTRAVVHRSPPMAGNGDTRLFLCLNEVRDDS